MAYAIAFFGALVGLTLLEAGYDALAAVALVFSAYFLGAAHGKAAIQRGAGEGGPTHWRPTERGGE